MRKSRKILVVAGIIVGGLIAVGCASGGSTGAAPRNADTTAGAATASTAAAAPRTPVTVTGSGEAVKTVELGKGGYTVAYKATSFCIIAQPVNADGSDGSSIVNKCASDMNSKTVSGTSTFSASGPVTIHVSNVDGDWTLTFTPLG